MHRTVVVIGAGVSGLTIAFELIQRAETNAKAKSLDLKKKQMKAEGTKAKPEEKKEEPDATVMKGS